MSDESRLAVNAVTLENFDEPIKISLFVQDIFAGFTMVSFVPLYVNSPKKNISLTSKMTS